VPAKFAAVLTFMSAHLRAQHKVGATKEIYMP
jgi:hypothetical protein